MEGKDKIDNQESPDRMILKYNDTVFRDMDEFIMDMKNIFAQMVKTFQNYVEKTKTYISKNELDKLKTSLNEELTRLQEELKNRLDYITDNNKIDESITGDKRAKLIQLKALNDSLDITKNTLENLGDLVTFYNKRVLDEKLVAKKGIISRKKDNK